jgi:hypothetical protein
VCLALAQTFYIKHCGGGNNYSDGFTFTLIVVGESLGGL